MILEVGPQEFGDVVPAGNGHIDNLELSLGEEFGIGLHIPEVEVVGVLGEEATNLALDDEAGDGVRSVDMRALLFGSEDRPSYSDH